MKEVIAKKIIEYLGGTIIATLVYVVIMIASCFIPYEAIHGNIFDSSVIMEEQGLYPSSTFKNFSWDNWSDALLYNIMASQRNTNVLKSAVANYRVSSHEGAFDEITCMKTACESSVQFESELEDYSRYWLGNILILKCLSIFLDLDRIRFFISIVYIALQAWLIIKMRDEMKVENIVAYLVATCIVPTYYLVMCLSFSTDIIVMQLFMIAVLYLYKSSFWKKNRLFIYYLVGSFTFFINFLSVPLYTLAFPLVLEVQLQSEKKIKKIVSSVVAWVSGYSITVIGKQLLSKLVLGYESGMDHIGTWSGAKDSMSIDQRFSNVMDRFEEVFNYTNIMIILIVIVILVIVNIIRKNRIKMIEVEELVIYFILTVLPFAWLFVFAKHASHGFDNMYFAITIYSFMALLGRLFTIDKKDGNK